MKSVHFGFGEDSGPGATPSVGLNRVRYFDLRVMWTPRRSGGSFWIHHGGVAGPPLQTVLEDIRKFATEGHQELVILKFSHFSGIDARSYERLVFDVRDALGAWIIRTTPHNKRLADVTLSEYVEDGADGPAILVLVDQNFAIDFPVAGFWIYRNWNAKDHGHLCVFDVYSNVQTFDTMRTGQFEKFERFKGRMKHPHDDLPCDLFLLSWTLTPRSASPTPWQLSRRANPWLARDVRHGFPPPEIPNEHGKIINLLYVDYVESARVTDVALFQNGERVTAADGAKTRRRAKPTARRRTA